MEKKIKYWKLDLIILQKKNCNHRELNYSINIIVQVNTLLIEWLKFLEN